MRPSLERVSIWKGDDMCKPLRKYQMRPRITSMEQGDKRSGTLQPTKCCQTGLHVHIPMNAQGYLFADIISTSHIFEIFHAKKYTDSDISCGKTP